MSNYYRYAYKNSNLEKLNSVSADEFAYNEYGTEFRQDYPLTSSISVDFYPDAQDPLTSIYDLVDPSRKRIHALKNTLHKYRKYSPYFEYQSDLVDYENDNICLVSIPSIFYGDSIEKGSVQLSTYKDGILLSKVQDIGKNGELIIVDPPQLEKKVAGVVLYDEGFVLLFGSDSLDEGYTTSRRNWILSWPLIFPHTSSVYVPGYMEEFYSTLGNTINPDSPRWYNWGITLKNGELFVTRTSYDIEFNGVHKIPQVTMLTHAPRGELNHSNNNTYISYNEKDKKTKVGSTFISEDDTISIKNLVKTDYVTPIPDFHKETYISKILIYDEEKNVIGVAKLAKPVRKTEEREYTFKLKLDL